MPNLTPDEALARATILEALSPGAPHVDAGMTTFWLAMKALDWLARDALQAREYAERSEKRLFGKEAADRARARAEECQRAVDLAKAHLRASWARGVELPLPAHVEDFLRHDAPDIRDFGLEAVQYVESGQCQW